MSRVVSRNVGRWVSASTLRVYKVFIKSGWGPWLRGDSAWACWYNKLHSTICIVLLSEFVSQNAWLQQYHIPYQWTLQGLNARGLRSPMTRSSSQKLSSHWVGIYAHLLPFQMSSLPPHLPSTVPHVPLRVPPCLRDSLFPLCSIES